ncbi:MAG: carboxypeptidase-like regulatory domain-containing protein [Bryobacteraceae bacterium]|jgi:hypothetical protein
MLYRFILFGACACIALATDAASIQGIVLDSVTGAAVRKINVFLSPAGGRNRYLATTGADGSFSFDKVEPGGYFLAFESDAYRAADGPGGPLIHLEPGQQLRSLRLVAVPFGGISGTILGPEDEPLVEALVRLVQIKWSHGHRVASELRYALTDDRGYYRFDGLDSGAYYILANWQLSRFGIRTVLSGPGLPEMAMVWTYFPYSASIPEASPVRVVAGRETSGIDMHLKYERTFHIKGVLKDAGPIDTFTNKTPGVAAARNDGVVKDYGEFGGWFRQDGSFEAVGVPAGDYLVRESYRTEILSSTARTRVESADAVGIVLNPNRFDVHVRARFDGDPSHDLSKWGAGLTPTDRIGSGLMIWNHSGVIQNVAPGQYLFKVYPNEEVYVKQVLIGGKEVTGSEIELSNAGDQMEFVLAKGVRDVEGEFDWPEPRPVNVCVILVSEHPRPGDWAVIRRADIDQRGHFEFLHVPPGRFRAFIVRDFDEDLWENREFYRFLEEKGLAVDVEPGTENSPAIRIKPPRLSDAEVQDALARLGN